MADAAPRRNGTRSAARHALLALQLSALAVFGACADREYVEPQVVWREVQSGVAYALIAVDSGGVPEAARIHVVRSDPSQVDLRAVMAAQHELTPRTAATWAREFELSVAINLGMYQTDLRSNVGYARNGSYVNNSHWATRYKTALAFGPRRSDIPRAVMVDLDQPAARETTDDYDAVIQNLRLIKAPGENVWEKQHKRWSEAAVASDAEGRILFIFCDTPYAMWELNRILLDLPLDIVRAMHVEGGPEASLSIRGGGIELDLNGTFESGFVEDVAINEQWRIPNVIGIAASSNELRTP